MINYLTAILEKCNSHDEEMFECLKALNVSHLLNIDSEIVGEAVIDMIKNVFILSPQSPIILDMCC